jgi:hypothetical protein
MEIVLTRCEGEFPQGSFLSVRAGNTVKRQSLLEPGKLLKLPCEAIKGADGRPLTEVTVEALAVLGRGTVYLKQDIEKYGLSIESTCENRNLNWDVEVRWSREEAAVQGKVHGARIADRLPVQSLSRDTAGNEKRSSSSGRRHRHSHAISAQKYLTKHKLLEAMHEALQAAVKDRPENPLAYMSQKLLKISEEAKLHQEDLQPTFEVKECTVQVDSEPPVQNPFPTCGDNLRTRNLANESTALQSRTPPSEGQPSPEPSPTQARVAARHSSDESQSKDIAAGARAKDLQPVRLLSKMSLASNGDIEGELEEEQTRQVAANMLVEESWCEASKLQQAAQAADARLRAEEAHQLDSVTSVADPRASLGQQPSAADEMPGTYLEDIKTQRERRAFAAELRSRIEIDTDQPAPKPQDRPSSPPRSPLEREHRAKAAEDRMRLQGSEQSQAADCSPHDSAKQLSDNIFTLASFASIEDPLPFDPLGDYPARASSIGGATADQCLFDETDFGTRAAAQDVAIQGMEQVQRFQNPEAVGALRQQLLSQLEAKLHGNELDEFVRNIFAASSSSGDRTL